MKFIEKYATEVFRYIKKYGNACALYNINKTNSQSYLYKYTEKHFDNLINQVVIIDTINEHKKININEIEGYPFCYMIEPWTSSKNISGFYKNTQSCPNFQEILLSHINMLLQQMDSNGVDSRNHGFHRPLKSMLYIHYTQGPKEAFHFYISMIKRGIIINDYISFRILNDYIYFVSDYNQCIKNFETVCRSNKHKEIINFDLYENLDNGTAEFAYAKHTNKSSSIFCELLRSLYRIIYDSNNSNNLSEWIEFQTFILHSTDAFARIKQESRPSLDFKSQIVFTDLEEMRCDAQPILMLGNFLGFDSFFRNDENYLTMALVTISAYEAEGANFAIEEVLSRRMSVPSKVDIYSGIKKEKFYNFDYKLLDQKWKELDSFHYNIFTEMVTRTPGPFMTCSKYNEFVEIANKNSSLVTSEIRKHFPEVFFQKDIDTKKLSLSIKKMINCDDESNQKDSNIEISLYYLKDFWKGMGFEINNVIIACNKIDVDFEKFSLELFYSINRAAISEISEEYSKINNKVDGYFEIDHIMRLRKLFPYFFPLLWEEAISKSEKDDESCIESICKCLILDQKNKELWQSAKIIASKFCEEEDVMFCLYLEKNSELQRT